MDSIGSKISKAGVITAGPSLPYPSMGVPSPGVDGQVRGLVSGQ